MTDTDSVPRMEATHEHYWVDAPDDETGWHCTLCGVTEYPARDLAAPPGATRSPIPEPLPSRSCRHGINPDECEFCDSPGADKEEATRQALRATRSPDAPDFVMGCTCTCHLRYPNCAEHPRAASPSVPLDVEVLREAMTLLRMANPRMAVGGAAADAWLGEVAAFLRDTASEGTDR